MTVNKVTALASTYAVTTFVITCFMTSAIIILIEINIPQAIIVQRAMATTIVTIDNLVVGNSKRIVNVQVIDVSIPKISISDISFLFVKSN